MTPSPWLRELARLLVAAQLAIPATKRRPNVERPAADARTRATR